MQILPHPAGARRPTQEEIKRLERTLNEAYSRLRERARAEWLRYHGGKADPADARVSVRITAGSKPSPPAESKSKRAARRLLPKPRNRRGKLARTQARRPKYVADAA